LGRMNRQARREMDRRRRRAGTKLVVLLKGGPMDGANVTPDAPALAPDWPPPRDDYDYGAGRGWWGHYGPVSAGAPPTSEWIPDSTPYRWLASLLPPHLADRTIVDVERRSLVDLTLVLDDGRRAVFWRPPGDTSDAQWVFGSVA
jgi:hypothetical protein